MRDLVQPYFAQLGLRVNDPGFYVQALPESLVHCVIFQLPEEDEQVRLLKVHRFLSARSQYVGRKIRMGLAGVKAPRELELANKMGAHIVKGPLISALFATPVADQPLPLNALPLRT